MGGDNKRSGWWCMDWQEEEEDEENGEEIQRPLSVPYAKDELPCHPVLAAGARRPVGAHAHQPGHLFLGAVGELARGLSTPSVVPVRHDPSLPEIPQLLAALGPSLDLKPVEFAYTDVTIPWSFVNRIKAEFRGVEQWCSTFEVVAAAIWQCRTRAIDADPGSPAPLIFTANMRTLVGKGAFTPVCKGLLSWFSNRD
uniref:Uncharacterized protein n=1 Tax=Aegilops tauschii TaxID=37682 RepID=N1QYH7_AEGTA